MYIVPKPKKVEENQGIFTIYYNDRISIDASWKEKADYAAGLLRDEIKEQTGFNLLISRSFLQGKGEIRQPICLLHREGLGEQTYEVEISESGIVVAASNAAGLLFGVQSLRQIIRQAGACIPCIKIWDEPDFLNRGFYHDVTRGRIPTLSFLKDMVDLLSFYKINQLQLYVEHSYLFAGLSEMWRDDTPLTPEDIMELDAYCVERSIELVPSLSSFGHLCKLLSTKTYNHMCELPDADKLPFSFWNRMEHHTIDVTQKEGIELIKSMIEEIMPLFTSNQFNICADETFDLGKGRSKDLAGQVGVERMYIDYVKELCEFLLEKGKRPMFWGDIICGFPELISELPKETICLNWGYAADVSEESTRKLYEAGATQYCCPGVAGWNQIMNQMEVSYENIKRMCSYARKYHALGVLNTDWGDFGHINHPTLSFCGIIYGAAFSWSEDTPGFDELNRQISRLEYGDATEELAGLAAQISPQTKFSWEYVVRYMEMVKLGHSEEEQRVYFGENKICEAREANNKLEKVRESFYKNISNLDREKRERVIPYLVAIEGIEIFNEIGMFIAKKKYQSYDNEIMDGYELAIRLETWFYDYKKLWRSVSRESELFRLQNLINEYANMLRENY